MDVLITSGQGIWTERTNYNTIEVHKLISVMSLSLLSSGISLRVKIVSHQVCYITCGYISDEDMTRHCYRNYV